MSEHQTRVLVLGATGKIGSSLLRVFASSPGLDVMGTVRASHGELLPATLRSKLVGNVDVDNFDTVIAAFAQARPDVVINCVGMIKQLPGASEPLAAIPLNALLPHRLANLCAATESRLVQISSDCVFSGDKGNYLESDPADAQDLYGRSKALGEVDYPHAVTLRTSTIGRALQGNHSLLDWFLSTTGPVKGFRRAIFSGVPAHELARIIRDFVIPFPELRGLYHVSGEPIDKYTLLKLIAIRYGRDTQIDPDDDFVIDRSLNSGRFRDATGYAPQDWPKLIDAMYEFG